ncbi:MAG: copper homeostasis protein CutC [Anaerolineales bacterium]|nr:copper homeostasis protein CutC [Anaerolineales bacterium]
MSIVLEICIDSVESAIAAQEGGANRVELCDNLLEGGTTPSAGTIALARKHIGIDLNVIIRPRGGDFFYSDIEFEVMKYDIEQAKALGANGVVIGLLNRDGTVDVERTAALVKLARPLSVTFHRAFDMSRDPREALETLISLGLDRVLTTGQESSALEGLDLITELVQQAADRIIIMPGLSSGVSERTVRKIVGQSGVKEVHTGAGVVVESQMTYRNPRSFMGGELRPPEFALTSTSARRVSEFVKAVRS